MPGCITHYIFAKDCFDKLDNNNLKNILSKNINIYLIKNYRSKRLNLKIEK